MLIHSIKLNNILSFGCESVPVSLHSLNVIIGPNGSGKPNLLESIESLRSAPEQLLKPIREGGGVRDWLWIGLALNRLRREPAVQQRLLKALRALYEGIEDYDVHIEGGTVQSAPPKKLSENSFTRHSRMLLAGIHRGAGLDFRQKHAGMTVFA